MSDLAFTPTRKGIKAILFDLGDTLIHGNFTAGATGAIWEEIYSRLILVENSASPTKLVPPLEKIREALAEHVGRAMALTWKEKTEKEIEILPLFRAAFEAAGLSRANEEAFLRQIIELEQKLLYERVVEVGRNTRSTLQTLQQKGYLLGLVSNFCNLSDVVYLNLDRLGLLQFFNHTLLSCELGWRKPSPIIYTAICEKLQVLPTQCLFVGDRLIEDIQGPQQAGMQAILTHEFRQEEIVPPFQPDGLITSLDQLFKYLD